jgi:hypothetical protein
MMCELMYTYTANTYEPSKPSALGEVIWRACLGPHFSPTRQPAEHSIATHLDVIRIKSVAGSGLGALDRQE